MADLCLALLAFSKVNLTLDTLLSNSFPPVFAPSPLETLDDDCPDSSSAIDNQPPVPLFAMGLFKRKDSKNSIQSDKDEQDSFASVNSARTSNASLRSPGYKGSGLPTSIPELPIARPPDPALDPAAYLRSIHAVRERSRIIFDKAKKNRLNHFDVDMTKFKATASYIVSIIKVRAFSSSSKPLVLES